MGNYGVNNNYIAYYQHPTLKLLLVLEQFTTLHKNSFPMLFPQRLTP